MTGPLTFVSHNLIHFGAYYTWVDLKQFEVDPTQTDGALLAHLIEHGRYHDHYAGEDADAQSHHSLHGPYRLSGITADTFRAVTPDAARTELQEWVASWVEDEDRPDVEATMSASVLGRLSGDAVWRLPDLRETVEHDWGWVVGSNGFLEFVIIDRSACLLTLLVASDD